MTLYASRILVVKWLFVIILYN